jgi:hypothetical protein
MVEAKKPRPRPAGFFWQQASCLLLLLLILLLLRLLLPALMHAGRRLPILTLVPVLC